MFVITAPMYRMYRPLFSTLGIIMLFPCVARTAVWAPAASFDPGRYMHTSTLLPNGKILVAGGSSLSKPINLTELLDPATGRWSAAGFLNYKRYAHTATLLPNGYVLIAGGYGGNQIMSTFLAYAELYNPATTTATARPTSPCGGRVPVSGT